MQWIYIGDEALGFPGADLPRLPTESPLPDAWTFRPHLNFYEGFPPNRYNSLTLHPDVYLRAAEVALDDVDEQAAFMSTYGPMTVNPSRASGRAFGPGPDGARELIGIPIIRKIVEHVPAELRDETSIRKTPPDMGHQAWLSQAEVWSAFASIRWLVQTWCFLTEDGREPDLGAPPLSWFAHILNSCLGPLGPRALHVGRPEDIEAPEWVLLEQTNATLPLLSVLALQLAHHAQDGVPHKICHNEKCRKLFNVQDDESTHGRKHRTDALYHSTKCAAQQRQRNRRRAQGTPRL